MHEITGLISDSSLRLLRAGNSYSANPNLKGLPIMKLAIRIFALLVVVAGGGAAATYSSTTLVSHQSATAAAPNPYCGPGMPYCPPPPPPPSN
jgi:hypothetical protein